ncbi:MAG: hypothetical protein NT040_05235 [Bacteroidetes bacterium]|nr:hypothetical protein [Bacteroidota bacterium]
MKNLAVIIIAVLVVVAVSCKKDTENNVVVTKPDYFQLKVGNSWIYQSYYVDTNGVATPTGDFDSAYVEKDTVIRGFTYHKILENPYVLSWGQYSFYLRDSSGYLVNNHGYILASYVNFTDILEVDTSNPLLYTGYVKMTGKDSVFTLAGTTVESITSRKQVVPSPPNTENLPVRYTYEVYGKGVGKMKSHTFFFMGGMAIESRLMRYNVH